MPRRTSRSREADISKRSIAAEDVVSPNDAARDARVEEERQIRVALAEYFSILREWSTNGRRRNDATDPNADSMTS
jgi:hypothetical protein